MGEPEDPEKTTDLWQVTDKLYHVMLCSSPWSRFELTTSVVIGTEFIGSCRSNYHMIMATTLPQDCRGKSKENNDNKTGQIALHMGPSWSWPVIAYGKMIYNYQRIQCLAITTKSCEFEPRSWRGTLDKKHFEHYVMMFVSDLLVFSGTSVSSPNKANAMIWLKYCWRWR